MAQQSTEHGRVDVPAATLEALMDAAAAVLAADSLAETFGRMARRLGELVPHDDLVVYEVDPTRSKLAAVFAHGDWIDEVMAETFPIAEGITGRTLRQGVTSNVTRSDLDPGSKIVPGTRKEPESLVCVPLVVEEQTIGALNVYRTGEDVTFSSHEAEVIERFATIAALAYNSARQRELLIAQARTDPLTGLLNRRAFLERLDAELARAERTTVGLSVVMIDIDRFKAINDTHGHTEGDRTLRAIGERLRGTVRTDEAIARFGGEEFALIVAAGAAEQAREAAERTRAAIAGVSVHGSTVSSSAGVASWPLNGTSADELLDAADQALYKAKRAGRGRTEIAESVAQPPG
jgi:diguanylate cyclase (GGDEF)-like protein